MRKYALFAVTAMLATSGCSKYDPVLPGTRTPIFNDGSAEILNLEIANLPDAATEIIAKECPYTQDSSNAIWTGDKKIFNGFPTTNYVASEQTPVCSGRFIYAGLTTGELVKLDSTNRQIVWIADIFQTSNVTGGAPVLDIVAPIVIHNNEVLVAGMGNTFCKLGVSNGNKKWCARIGSAQPFTITDAAIFVVSLDNYLYAVRPTDGAVFWRTKISQQTKPLYENKIVTVGKTKINAETGALIEE